MIFFPTETEACFKHSRIKVLPFELIDLQTRHIGIKVPTFRVIQSGGSPPKTLDGNCRKEVPERKLFGEILPWAKPTSVEW